MKLRRYRPVSVVLLLLHLGACTTWRPIALSPRQLIDERPQSIRIWRSGAPLVVSRPSIENDSIVVVEGTCRPIGLGRYRRYVCPTTAIAALGDVDVVEVRSVNRGRSLLLLIPIVAFFGVLAGYRSACSQGSFLTC